MIDQAKRDELVKDLPCWPTGWSPCLDEDGDWTGEWSGTDDRGDTVEIDGSPHSDYALEFAKFVATLVNVVPGLFAELTRLESLYAAASSTADSLEAIDRSKAAMIVGYQQTIATLEIDLQATAAGAVIRHGEDEKRIAALEAGLYEADEYVRCLLDEDDDSSPVAVRMAALRKLAGES